MREVIVFATRDMPWLMQLGLALVSVLIAVFVAVHQKRK